MGCVVPIFFKKIEVEEEKWYCKTWPHRTLLILEVYCDNLQRDEIKELLALLEGLLFKYISVDTKSIKAVKEGYFREIYQAMKKLEKEVFSWSE